MADDDNSNANNGVNGMGARDRPVTVSSTSSLDSFCLATADLLQGNDLLSYNAVMGGTDQQSSSLAAGSAKNATDGNSGGTESPTNTGTTTNLKSDSGDSSVVSPGAGAAHSRAVSGSAQNIPSMPLPQQQQESTNSLEALLLAPSLPTIMSQLGEPSAPLGVGQPAAQQPTNPPPLPCAPPAPQAGSLVSVVGGTSNTSVPEFLFQLTRMLTDDNREVIEWSNGKIEVHSPHKLESDVLHKYFRHSKFASFQRQLNYFGFRKLAGKGKMAPCSYVNELVTGDLTSLLHVKRKTATTTRDGRSKKSKDGTASKTASRKVSSASDSSSAPAVNPVLAGILHRSAAATTIGGNNKAVPTVLSTTALQPKPALSTIDHSQVQGHKAVAKIAVGRGIRHAFSATATSGRTAEPLSAVAAAAPPPVPSSAAASASASAMDASSFTFPEPTTSSLSQLADNYRSSLNDLQTAEDILAGTDPTPLDQMKAASSDMSSFAGGFLSRNSSLIDLAMIPTVEEGLPPSTDLSQGNIDMEGLSFVDFPHPSIYPPAASAAAPGDNGGDANAPDAKKAA